VLVTPLAAGRALKSPRQAVKEMGARGRGGSSTTY